MKMAQAANEETPHPAIQFISSALFGGTEQPVFFQSLANDPADLDEARHKPTVLTRDIAQVLRFIAKHDRNRRGLFVAVATQEAGSATRNKDNSRETIGLHADLDFKGVVEDEPTIWARIADLRYQPTVIVRSGGGIHLYWLFREALNTQEYRDFIEGALRRLADIVAGDVAVCDVCRLMRVPGTHNSKRGDMREVVIERLDGPRYELDELEEWFSEQQPVLTRKVVEPKAAKAAEPASDNPVPEARPAVGLQAPSGRRGRAGRDGRGEYPHDAARRGGLAGPCRPADRRSAGDPDGGRPHGRRSRLELAGRGKENPGPVRAAAKKFPPKDVPQEVVDEKSDELENVVDLGEARAKRKPKMKGPNALLAPFVVADGVIDRLRAEGMAMMLSEGEVWIYGEGFWRVMAPADQQWLLTLIQEGFEELGEPGKTSSLSSTWKRLNEHPRLYRATVPWANGGMVVCRNGVLRLDTGHFEGHRPENYARRSIGADYVAGAICPRFEALLYSMLGRADLIDLVQEWLGAALSIGSLSREERRALILVGPSRTGKTELAKIFSLLFGSPIATPSVAAVSEDRDRFALSTLYLGAAAWVRDDAINEGDKLNPQRFKTIVTGEPVDIEIKHRAIVASHRFEIPVCLTANSLPKAIDGSDAIFNRSLILRMEKVVDDVAAAKARTDNGVRPGQSIGQAIFEAEASGILNWALAGLARLRARGFYDIPESVRDAISRFKDDNNPIGEWAREAIAVDPHSKVERRDLVRSFNGWEFEQDGEKAIGRGGRWLMPRLRNQVSGLGENKVRGLRYITGLKLTEVGLAMWKTYGERPTSHGGSWRQCGDRRRRQ